MPINPPPPTWVTPLTASGRGAIATLRVEGPDASKAVGATFRAAGRPALEWVTNDLIFGHFTDTAEHGEPVVARRASDEVFYLHCHGGLAAVARIESALIRFGCRRLTWRDWAKRHYEDPIQSAARSSLADASTMRVAAILLDQYHGALRRAVDEIQTALVANDTLAAGRMIETLLARAALGLHLVRPWRVVLAGQPNVGKSSLINAMLGYRRAIVHPTPGTTRDALTAETAIDGWPVELSDTAGLRRGGHPVEQAGVELAESRLADADLAVLVFDASQPWSDTNDALIERWPFALLVLNKCDLASDLASRPLGMPTSAKTGEGIDTLLRAIGDHLMPSPPLPGAAVPWTSEQIENLRAISTALAKGEPAESIVRMMRI